MSRTLAALVRFLPHRGDYDLRSWRQDLLAGVTVAVVAGPYRSAAYVGNRESIGAIETAAT